jgi:hypothetical protein
MQCRHTVPDWHRYVNPAADAVPIFAGCRLLVKEGEPASDPRGIACAYWGHQRDCPLYDGPGARARGSAGWPPRVSAEVPVAPEAVWPVRTPGAKDGMRLVLIGLGVLSTALLLWTALRGQATLLAHPHVIVTAASVSIVTHVVATLRTWGRR